VEEIGSLSEAPRQGEPRRVTWRRASFWRACLAYCQLRVRPILCIRCVHLDRRWSMSSWCPAAPGSSNSRPNRRLFHASGTSSDLLPTYLHWGWRFGVVVTRWSPSTSLTYAEPG